MRPINHWFILPGFLEGMPRLQGFLRSLRYNAFIIIIGEGRVKQRARMVSFLVLGRRPGLLEIMVEGAPLQLI